MNSALIGTKVGTDRQVYTPWTDLSTTLKQKNGAWGQVALIDNQQLKKVKCPRFPETAQIDNETYIPAQQYQAKAPPWFSRSHAYQSRAADPEVTQSQRQEALVRLSRFQRKHRLNSEADFNNVFKTSCRSRDSQFVVLARRNEQTFARLGLAISRKAVRTAVSRNKVKRAIRESFRTHADILTGLDIVVLAQQQVKPGESRIMNQSLRSHWQRILQCAQ